MVMTVDYTNLGIKHMQETAKVDSVLWDMVQGLVAQSIANDIIGVQPMKPSFQINWRSMWKPRRSEHPNIRRVAVKSEIYNVFVRLNNRRRTQSDRDFEQAGYRHVTGLSEERILWCQQQFGQFGYWRNRITHNVWFATESDYYLYIMGWK
jgi:hypothetical protein